MRVVVPSISHCGFIAEEILGAPRNNVSLPHRHIGSACWAAIVLFCAVGRDLANKPLGAAVPLFAGTAVCEAGDVARRRFRRALILVDPAVTRHSGLPPVV